MEDGMTPLERLGKAIADAQEAEIRAHVERAGRNFDEARAMRSSALMRARVWGAIAAAVVASVLSALLLQRSSPGNVTFELESGQPGALQEWVEAPDHHDVPLRFSDRTTILLSAGTRGRVENVGPRGARMRIVRGRAAVSVPPGRGADWTFDVGPFEVLVTGTRFDVGWDPDHEAFALAMQDGSVKVKGPSIDGTRVVVAGQTIEVQLHPDAAAHEEPKLSTARADQPVSLPVSSMPNAVPSSRTAATPIGRSSASDASWRQLAVDGKFDESLATVGARYDAICDTASSADVLLLGDVARYTGNVERAELAYLAVRRRFAGTVDATSAAFTLGRLAFSAGNDHAAVDWFDTCLREQPRGPLAREALGNEIEAHLRLHDTPSAMRLANEYLRAYPDGPHAKLARSLSAR